MTKLGMISFYQKRKMMLMAITIKQSLFNRGVRNAFHCTAYFWHLVWINYNNLSLTIELKVILCNLLIVLR